jgi:hypothetical protein
MRTDLPRFPSYLQFAQTTATATHPNDLQHLLAAVMLMTLRRQPLPTMTPTGREGFFPLQLGPRIAVIQAYGFLSRRSTATDESFGITGVDAIIEQIRAALEDDFIKGICVEFCSQGAVQPGAATELADAIASAAKRKRTISVLRGRVCSGAYWAASFAEAILATRGCEISNLRVYDFGPILREAHDWNLSENLLGHGSSVDLFEHQDSNQRALFSGGEEAAAKLSEVMAIDICSARGLDIESFRTIGAAMTFSPDGARAVGLVDGIPPNEDVIQKIILR